MIQEHRWIPEPNTGCWLWMGAMIRNGYGVLRVRGEHAMAHREMYEQEVGPIPAGLILDHLCRNPSCINPQHLEIVTTRENVLRGLRGRLRTRCAHGHAYADGNLMMDHYADGQVARRCRTCKLATNRATRARRRLRAGA